ncbi:MAG: glucose-6-phosphate isomerase family protein [Methanothrix sp.]|nr:glucose-6-phosphate isomerase family protein [Methanothrix sp.]MDD3710027.1 glucose-6-phosphate isomerase family protein [Methanothrix sp.]MDD5768695.1 glucose-6-phosphate isomerase family protein [Methanothrix sp.]MDI9399028.1 glucose-6-phosphate isomerase family protein [Euryarchaeota archaeon]
MNELEFAEKTKEPDVRMLRDMDDVLYDKKWAKVAENLELYYMYRDLFLSRRDGDLFKDQGIRYDITIIPPLMLGCEYVKTAGHYHPKVPGEDVTYPEVYEVLEGEATYLLQKEDLSDVVVVRARGGDKVVVPPDYGHITINESNKRLKMANFVARDFSSIYDPIKERGGGAYFLTEDGFVENPRCEDAAPLREIEVPKAKALGLSRNREIYPIGRERGTLDWLLRPQDYMDIFEGFLD